MILHQRPLRTIYNILSLTNCTHLTTDAILWCTKNSCFQLMIFISFYIQKVIVPSSYGAPFSHLTSCTPTMSNLYLANSLAAAVSEPAVYSLLKFHVPNKMTLFFCLLCDAISRNTPPPPPNPPENRMGEYFTFG